MSNETISVCCERLILMTEMFQYSLYLYWRRTWFYFIL